MLRKKIVNTIIVLTLGTFLFSFKSAYAIEPQDYGLQTQKTLPGSQLYIFKRAKEKLKTIFTFSFEKKVNYFELLLEKRLSETISLVNSNNQSQILNSSNRYSYQAGILTEYISKREKGKGGEITQLFSMQKPILETLRDMNPANTAHWLLFQQNIDTLEILSNKLK